MNAKSILTFAATVLMAGSLVESARAGVVFQFEEVGGNVVATPTGSIQVSGSLFVTSPTASIVVSANSYSFLYRTVGEANIWISDTWVLTDSPLLSLSPTASGSTFGYWNNQIYLPTDAEYGSTYTPDTLWVWENKTLEEIGLGDLTTTPFEVFNADGETISFALAPVPEPGTSALLIGGGVAAFVAWRRRRSLLSRSESLDN